MSPTKRASASGDDLFLIVELGSKSCAFSACDVVETMRPLDAEPLPDMPQYMLGIAVIRGLPTPVVDLSWLLGDAKTQTASRYVSIRVEGDRIVALAVPTVPKLRSLASAELTDLPPLFGHADEERIARLGKLDEKLLLVLNKGALLSPEFWQEDDDTDDTEDTADSETPERQGDPG
ncbi:MAG: chemotaxis protein CheW [Actinomycetia bacterium]|nr:chemotaxis protein CheW [Actinomycetes bacterium]